MGNLVEGAVAIVTGGASGLGRRVAERLGEEGAKAVIVLDMVEEPREGGQSTVAHLAAQGVASRFIKGDVTNREDIAAAVRAADEFGGVTVLVTCAGILMIDPFLDITEADYDRVMNINAKGTFFSAQAAARSMVEGKREGSIILISSFGGILGSGSGVTYNASKGAVKLMAYAMGDALGPHGIRVNAIHPGFMETAMTAGLTLESMGWKAPLGRAGRPEDVANMAVFLASPLASYLTSSSYLVDGGITNTA